MRLCKQVEVVFIENNMQHCFVLCNIPSLTGPEQ